MEKSAICIIPLFASTVCSFGSIITMITRLFYPDFLQKNRLLYLSRLSQPNFDSHKHFDFHRHFDFYRKLYIVYSELWLAMSVVPGSKLDMSLYLGEGDIERHRCN